MRPLKVRGGSGEIRRNTHLPAWWDSGPFVFHLEGAARGLSHDDETHVALRPIVKELFVSARPQALVAKAFWGGAYAPDVVWWVAARRMRGAGVDVGPDGVPRSCGMLCL